MSTPSCAPVDRSSTLAVYSPAGASPLQQSVRATAITPYILLLLRTRSTRYSSSSTPYSSSSRCFGVGGLCASETQVAAGGLCVPMLRCSVNKNDDADKLPDLFLRTAGMTGQRPPGGTVAPELVYSRYLSGRKYKHHMTCNMKYKPVLTFRSMYRVR